MVYKLTEEVKVPMFNSAVFLENKQEIGKLDEIFGPINQVNILVSTTYNLRFTSLLNQLKVL